MLDPGSDVTDLWKQYDWNLTTQFVYFKATKQTNLNYEISLFYFTKKYLKYLPKALNICYNINGFGKNNVFLSKMMKNHIKYEQMS